MPDTWHCECGYTNLGSKTCLVCRRPRQAVPPPRPEAAIDEPPPPPEPAEKPAKRPVRSRATAAKKRAPRKKSD